MSSIAARHAAATSRTTRRESNRTRDSEEEGGNNDESPANTDKWPNEVDGWEAHPVRGSGRRNTDYWSDSSGDREREASKKKASRKYVANCKLYAIVQGRGGPTATGLC